VIAGALLLAGAVASCPVERASYTLRSDAGITARFTPAPTSADWPAGLLLSISFARSGRTWSTLPWNGGTDRRQHLRLVRVPGDRLPPDVKASSVDLDFLSTDEGYAFGAAVPRRGERAPAHLLLPGAGGVLRHATADAVRDELPTAFFDLAGCAAETPVTAPIPLPAVP
jgi:hypothetical protein